MHLKTNADCSVTMYYWHPDAKSSNAEVDYLITKGSHNILTEVKSVKKGTMQSLRIFMNEKTTTFAVRVSNENYAEYENIKAYPLYGIEEQVNGEIGI